MTNFEKVKHFMRVFRQDTRASLREPEVETLKLLNFRNSLLIEEQSETYVAFDNGIANERIISAKNKTTSKNSTALLRIGAYTCLFFAWMFFPGIPCASWAEEKRRVFLWRGDAASVKSFEKLCEERNVTSADVFKLNACAPLPSAGEVLMMPSAKDDLNAAWMEIQTQKNNSIGPLVSVKLHSVPKKLRADRSSVTDPISENSSLSSSLGSSSGSPSGSSLLSSLRSEVSADAENSTKLTVSGAALHTADQKPAAELNSAAQAPLGGAAVKDDKMTWPVGGKITSGFGRRGKRRFHFGIDIPMPKGTPIFAAQDGVVLDIGTTKSKNYRGYGNTVLLDHGSGIITLYAHCQSVSVKKGQVIKQGEAIAFVGNTGRSTTAHVHFEVRKDGKAVNPIPYLASR